MSLVTNDLSSLYGGVNQQAAEHRNSNQVEEMINAMPTIDRGLLKRNPTVRKELSQTVEYSSEIWNYEYDRGTAGDSQEQYSVSITQDNGLEIININTGKVYTRGNNGINFSESALNYIYPFTAGNGYAATTVKDTTFLVNKSVLPRLNPSLYNPEDEVVDINTYYVDIPYYSTPSPTITGSGNKGMDSYLSKAAPMNALVSFEAQPSGGVTSKVNANLADYSGATISITVDGLSAFHTVGSKWQRTVNKDGYGYKYILYPETFSHALSSLISKLSSLLETTGLYSISVGSNKIRIKSNEEEKVISASINIQFPPSKEYYSSGYDYSHGIGVEGTSRLMNPIKSDYFGDVVVGSEVSQKSIPNNSYLSTGFIWVKRAASVDSFNYIATVKYAGSGAIKFASVSGASTDVVATNLANKISENSNLTAVAIGSIVKITTDNDAIIEYVSISDSYGNQASGAFGHTVATMNDLPSNMEFEGTVIKVSGTENGVFQTYWVKYDGSVWKETKDPEALSSIDNSTMPHILTRESDDTFTIKEYDGWSERTVGDNNTNEYPSFVSNGKVTPSPIKDIFFFKNRLGFITSTTVAMSEVGEYGNFWRTTVFAVLDSDPIDTSVDSNKAIELEYASYLEDSLMLFADKAQFRLSGSKLLSPTSVQISQTSAYETDRNVRPIFLNDKIFFVVKRGENSALYEYFISDTSDKSEAIDVTAHVQTYIPNHIVKLSGSPVNNMLFAFSKNDAKTIYVYKYYDAGGTRHQSAWFKWTFNGEIYNAFSFGKYLNILINREQSIVVEDWVVSNGIWDNIKLWDNDKSWVMSPESLVSNNQFEQMDITPKDFNGTFIDDDREIEDRSNVVALNIDSASDSGNVISREDINILLISDVAEVRISHDIQAGGLLTKVYTQNNIYEATSYVGDTETLITIGKSLNETIKKITTEPIYTERTTARYSGVSCIYKSEGNELIYNNGVNGWYIDGVPLPETPDENIGEWTKEFGTKTAGSIIPTEIHLGEWVTAMNDKKTIRGHMQFKTIQVSSEEGSDFSLSVKDIKRNTSRDIKSKYTVGRKPMIYGNSKDVRIIIENSSSKGFRINTVSYEGNYNSRNKGI